MQSLVTAVSEVPVYDRETEILYSVLGRLKIDDIALSYDENGLVAVSYTHLDVYKRQLSRQCSGCDCGNIIIVIEVS